MKKIYWILIVVAVIVVGWLFIRFFIGESENSWIKDEKGVYVKHGFPSEIPDYVKEQQDAVACALSLYQQKKTEGISFFSQCLGTCNDYAVDIVNVPRASEDNLVENQCKDYREGKVSKFIELDKDGEIVRVL